MNRALLLLLLVLPLGGATCGAAGADTLPAIQTEGQDVLGAGDVVDVRVFGEPDLSGVHEISPAGVIRLPMVGDVAAAGLTPDDLGRRIEAAYNEKYLRHAEVSLLVKEANSRRVYVLGAVAKPGPIVVDGRITVIDAIARAGGTTKIADPNRTLLTREANGEQLRVIVAVGDMGIGKATDVELVPGDILFVPESPF